MSSRVPKYDFEIVQGDHLELTFTLYEVAPTEVVGPNGVTLEGGVPLDITGYQFRAQFRADSEAGAVEMEAAFSAFVVLDGPGGKARLALAHQVTEGVKAKKLSYDIEAVPPNDEVFKILRGENPVTFENTRFSGQATP